MHWSVSRTLAACSLTLSCVLLVACGGPDEAPPPESAIEVGVEDDAANEAPARQPLTVAVASDEQVLVDGPPVGMEALASYVHALGEGAPLMPPSCRLPRLTRLC